MPPKPERRSQILRAAAALFRARGYQATTMDDLAAKLKLNKATIYHHFPEGKQDLLYQIYLGTLDTVLERLAELDEDVPPAERILNYFRTMVEFQRENLNESIVYFQQRPWLSEMLTKQQQKQLASREARARALVRRAIEDGIAHGEFVDVDPALATFGVMMVATATHEWLVRKPRSRDDIGGFYAEVTLNGLRKRNEAKRRPQSDGKPARRTRTAATA